MSARLTDIELADVRARVDRGVCHACEGCKYSSPGVQCAACDGTGAFSLASSTALSLLDEVIAVRAEIETARALADVRGREIERLSKLADLAIAERDTECTGRTACSPGEPSAHSIGCPRYRAEIELIEYVQELQR